MTYQHQFSLKEYNTFGIEAKAEKFISVNTITELKQVLSEEKNTFILGGGSNMLLTKNIEQCVVHVNLKGISVEKEDENHVWVTAAAGENWHEFVLWCIDKNYGGLENLSLIPGNVGTTPIQNIGAYGVEIKDCMSHCEALEIKTLEAKTFSNADCKFDYRESVFKNELKGQYIVTQVTFKLNKTDHILKTSYGAIDAELNALNIKNPSIKDVSNAVISIRSSKLPNPKELGNSGSFFKNPIVAKAVYEKLALQYPKMPHYVITDETVKIPAGWLIEQAGFKGKRFGETGVHSKQALVLVNYGNAKGIEVAALSKKIQATIKETFGIEIEAEVNII